MKVFITGGGGFLGHRLARTLMDRGALTGLDGKAEAVKPLEPRLRAEVFDAFKQRLKKDGIDPEKLDEQAVQFAGRAVGANLLGDVADVGVRQQPGLHRFSAGDADLGARLHERRVVRERELFQRLQAQRDRFLGRRNCLCGHGLTAPT